jgi:hypothetical protein
MVVVPLGGHNAFMQPYLNDDMRVFFPFKCGQSQVLRLGDSRDLFLGLGYKLRTHFVTRFLFSTMFVSNART